jgi:hypothetical protein
MEFAQLKVTLKISSKSYTSHLGEEELHATVDDQLHSHIIGEVSEVFMDEAVFNSVYDLKRSYGNLKRPPKRESNAT